MFNIDFNELKTSILDRVLAEGIVEGFDGFLEKIDKTKQEALSLGDQDTAKKLTKIHTKTAKKVDAFKKYLDEHPNEILISTKGKKKIIKAIKYVVKKIEKHGNIIKLKEKNKK